MSTEAEAPRDSVDIATQSLARPAAVMAVGTALSRLTGLGRVAALVFALGVAESRLADAYNLANTVPFVLYELVLGGILTSVFIPVVIDQLRTKDRDEAWEAVSALVSTAAVVLVGMTLITFLLSPVIFDLLTLRVPEGAAEEQRELATFFLRVLSPQIALLGLAAICAGLLNAHGRFGLPQFVPVLNNSILIATFLVFAAVVSGVPTVGSVQASTGQKLLLTLGTVGGTLAMLLIYAPAIRNLPGRLRLRVNFRHPAVRKIARLGAWTLFYVAFNAIGWGVSAALANGTQGGPTAYYTAFAFFQLPIGIAAVSIMTALVPKLSAHHVDGDQEAFRARLGDGIRMTALLLLPATAVFVVLAEPLVKVLLERGIVSAGSTELVAGVLRLFAVGLLSFAAFTLLLRAFYTRQDTRTPALINVAGTGSTIVLDFILIGPLGVKGLALAHSLGFTVGTVIAALVLRRRIGGLEGRKTIPELVKMLVASGLAAAAMVGMVSLIDGAMEPGGNRALVELLLAGATGVWVFVAAAWVLRVENLTFFERLLPNR